MKKLLLFSLFVLLAGGISGQVRYKEFKIYGSVFNTDKNPVADWDVFISGSGAAGNPASVKTGRDGSYEAVIRVPAEPVQTLTVSVKDPCVNIPAVQKFTTEGSSSQHDFIICAQNPPNPCKPSFKFSQLKNELVLEFSANPAIRDAKYYWSFGDGNTAEGNPVRHEFSKAGRYKVSLRVVSPSCTGSFELEVEVKLTVAPPPPPPPSRSIEARCCGSIQILSVPVTNASAPNTFRFIAKGDFKVNEVRWDFGDGELGTGAEVTHTYKTEGKYRVTAWLAGEDCKVELGAYVHVGKNSADPCKVDILSKANGLNVSFGLNTPQAPDKIFWNFGDGNSSSDLNPTHSYKAPGTYKVVVEFSVNGQYCRVEREIKVEDPVRDRCPFSIQFRQKGLDVSFSILSTIKYDKVLWMFGDGAESTLDAPGHTYAKPGTYQVVLVISYNGITCKITQEVKINSLTGPGTVSILDISPNPVDQEMTLRLKSSDKLTVVLVIVDVTGQSLKKKQVDLEPGENIVPWDVQDLKSGVYFITVYQGQDVVARSRFQKS
jgi:PKD repeat protein